MLTHNQESEDMIQHTVLQKPDSDGKVSRYHNNNAAKNPGTFRSPQASLSPVDDRWCFFPTFGFNVSTVTCDPDVFMM